MGRSKGIRFGPAFGSCPCARRKLGCYEKERSRYHVVDYYLEQRVFVVYKGWCPMGTLFLGPQFRFLTGASIFILALGHDIQVQTTKIFGKKPRDECRCHLEAGFHRVCRSREFPLFVFFS